MRLIATPPLATPVRGPVRRDDTMESSMSLSAIHGDSPGRLGFIDLVLSTFAFLLRLGFFVARREATLVRFEKDNVFVNIYHGRASYQVGLELGRLRDGDMYSLHELFQALAPNDIEQARCQTTDPEVLRQCLASIAATVERHCDALLAGNAIAFEKVDAAVAPLRKAATLQAQFGATIDRADKAWESKDFSKATDLYEKSAPALDETRIRRLEYLRKQERK
jgi:hypothetical protein